MSLVLQSSGGGQITIQEPATASNFTQDLPAASGTVVITGTTPTLNGITFPATQVPSADANTLDDYEEGTWTPASGGGSAGAALYTKIGRMVYIYGDITFTGVTVAVGNITGLPFVPSGQSAISISFQSVSGSPIGPITVAGTSRMDVYNLVQGNIAVGNNTRMIFFGGYSI
jgi:hypothetical protein